MADTHHECPRCGAITTGRGITKHDAEHRRFDVLEAAVDAALADGAEVDLPLSPWKAQPGDVVDAAAPEDEHAVGLYGGHL